MYTTKEPRNLYNNSHDAIPQVHLITGKNITKVVYGIMRDSTSLGEKEICNCNGNTDFQCNGNLQDIPPHPRKSLNTMDALLPFLSSNNATHKRWGYQPRPREEDPHMHPKYIDVLPLRRMFGRQSSNGYLEDIIQPSRKGKMMDGLLPSLSSNNATHQQWVHQPCLQEEDPHMHPQYINVLPVRRMFGGQSSNGNLEGLLQPSRGRKMMDGSLPFLSSNNARQQWMHQPRLPEEDPHMHPQYIGVPPLRRMPGRQSCNGYLEDIIQPSRKRKMMDGLLPSLSSNNATHQQWVHQPCLQEEDPHMHPQYINVLPVRRMFGGQSSNGNLEGILQPSRGRKMMDGSLPYLLPSDDTFSQWDNSKHQPHPPEEVKLQPPQKISKMMDGSLGYLSSKDNFQQGDDDMIQPDHHPAEDPHMQQLDVLPFDGDSDGQYLTGLLDDMIGPLPEQPKIGTHPSIPNLYDNETSQALDDVMQFLDIPPQTPIVDEGLHVSVFVDNETSQASDNVMQLLDIPHQTPIGDEGLHVSVFVDNETSQASDNVMQLLDIPHQTPIVNEGLHASAFVDKEDIEPKITDNVAGAFFRKQKIKCMTDLFTAKQVEEHIKNLRQQFGQSKAEVDSNQATSQCMNEHGCQICTKEELSFKPPSVYCSWCRFRILEKKTYYTALDRDMLHYVCTTCYTRCTGKSVAINGLSISKSRLKKNTYSEGTTEPWVQCTKCEGWQHQICALFNDIENKDRDCEYLCPNCYIQEIKGGERLPLPQDSVPGAKDLPRTSLSDYIENRLFAHLQKERQERADREGKKTDEVPGAEDLVVRVVLSIEKKTKVKQGFLDAFAEKNYPEEFPYKSKAILLFQKIEGVEVCLFAMYVQEYGLECASPNQRCVYLSYLDSVKYFTPDIKAANGDDLRTFVYHELLIGYLDYCKKQGFLTCYIWTCPPLKGDNYIFHCHPENQKAPNSVRLRKWYRSMLQKAKKENVVVSTTNLYDHFFKARPQFKSTVTLLPYFDGDYWPLLAEEKIRELKQEEYKHNVQSKGEKELSRKVLKTRGCAYFSEDVDIDNLLMQKLGDYIQPNKENFLMVQLHCICRHCCQPVLSGKPWICDDCKDFPLCERCYLKEQTLEGKEKHPGYKSTKLHNFSQVVASNVSFTPEDKNDTIHNDLFEDRQTFLHFCEKNHYQHDMLRRAQHSSMMILYHLHNQISTVFHEQNDKSSSRNVSIEKEV